MRPGRLPRWLFRNDLVSILGVLEMFPECSEQSSRKVSRREVWGSRVTWMFKK